MFVQSTLSAPELVADPPGPEAPYYCGVLHELIDMGADLARIIHRRAREQDEAGQPAEEPGGARDLAPVFERVTRGIRQNILLARKISEPVTPRCQMPRSQTPRVAARKRIIRAVEDAIQRSFDGDEAEALHGELIERLDSPDLEDDIDGRPVADVIADICRDLGLDAVPYAHPWKRRTPADIAVLRARAAGVAGMVADAEAARAERPRSLQDGPRNAAEGVRTGSDPPVGWFTA